MKIGKKQETVIKLLVEKNRKLDDLIFITGYEPRIINNIVSELVTAGILRKDEQGVISCKEKPLTQTNDESDKNLWIDIQDKLVKPKLKNLARIV